MHPNVSPRAHVYALLGPDLLDYLFRIARFNSRPEQPTRWEIEAHASPDFIERMSRECLGGVAIFSGRNRGEIERVRVAIEAGLNVLADKPLIIRRGDDPSRRDLVFHTGRCMFWEPVRTEGARERL